MLLLQFFAITQPYPYTIMSHNTLNYASRIREQGFRLTPQREIILDALCALGRHATVGELYERVQEKAPAIDRATVYRAIKFFVELQLVVSAELDGVTVYEIASHTRHHHLVCRRCGDIQALGDHHFHELLHHLEDEHGFRAMIDHLTIPGLCDQCFQAVEAKGDVR
jgi:Fe2+ or Zn2+ uptake regulation protein